MYIAPPAAIGAALQQWGAARAPAAPLAKGMALRSTSAQAAPTEEQAAQALEASLRAAGYIRPDQAIRVVMQSDPNDGPAEALIELDDGTRMAFPMTP